MIHPELPNSEEAEIAVLGSVFLNRDALTSVASWLQPGHFYQERHALIYAAMLACFQRRTPPDTRLVHEELRRSGTLEAIGGLSYLLSLADSIPTSAHIEHYARVVEQSAVERQLIDAGGAIARIGFGAGVPTDEKIAQAQAELTKIARRSTGGYVHISDAVSACFARYESGIIPGIPTGYADYDTRIGSLMPSDLIVIAARPSVGKTALALCIAKHVAQQGIGVGIVSMEMAKEQLTDRLIAGECGINLQDIMYHRVPIEDSTRLVGAMSALTELPIYIDDTPKQPITTIRARALQLLAEHEIGLLIVDYLQLGDAPNQRDRYSIVSEVSRGLKDLARESYIPVIATAQLSRAVEGRASKIPTMADLKESGQIEQDADIVGFLYREEMYDKNTKRPGITDWIIEKHRNGPVGAVELKFDATTTRFHSVSYRTPEGY